MEFFDTHNATGMLQRLSDARPNYIFSVSTEDDKQDIIDLNVAAFGDRTAEYCSEPTANRYVLARNKDGILVALTGLRLEEHSMYLGRDVSYTCINPIVAGEHLIPLMLRELLKVSGDESDIYCNCWHLKWERYPNMIRVMQKLGFEEIYDRWVHYDSRYCVECKHCKYTEVSNCTCDEDVYLLTRDKIKLL